MSLNRFAVFMVIVLVFGLVGCSSTQGDATQRVPFSDNAQYEIRAYQLSDVAQNGIMWCFKNPKEQDKTAIGVNVNVLRIPDDGSKPFDRALTFDPVRGTWTPNQWSSEEGHNWSLPLKDQAHLRDDPRLYPVRNEIQSIREENGYEYIRVVHEWEGKGHPFGYETEYGQSVSRTYVRSQEGYWRGKGTPIPRSLARQVYPEIDISSRQVSHRWAEMLETHYEEYKNK